MLEIKPQTILNMKGCNYFAVSWTAIICYDHNRSTRTTVFERCGSDESLDALFDHRFGILDYRSLNIKVEKIKKEQFQKTAVVNYPAHPTMTRITEYKNMTFEKNSKLTIISKEYPGTFSPLSKDFNEPYYPLATDEARNRYREYKELADNYQNLFLLGRLATYQYINMDQAIEDALLLAKKIISLK